MKVTIQLSIRDILYLNLYSLQKHPLRYLSLFLLIFLLVLVINSTAGYESPTLLYLSAGETAFVFLVIIPLGMILKYRKHRLFREPLEVEIDERGIHSRMRGNTADSPWSSVTGIERRGNFILVFVRGVVAYIVPSRFFSSRDEADMFFDKARDYLEKFPDYPAPVTGGIIQNTGELSGESRERMNLLPYPDSESEMEGEPAWNLVFDYTFRDSFRFAFLYNLYRPWNSLLISGALTLLFTMNTLEFFNNPEISLYGKFGAAVYYLGSSLVLVIGVINVLAAYIHANMVNRLKLHTRYHYRFFEEGYRIESDQFNTSNRWDTVTEVRKMGNYFLIRTNMKNSAIVTPDAFSSISEREEFFQYITAQWKKMKS